MTNVPSPPSDRPRERLLAHGPRGLADAELLALLLGTGRRGRSAVELARELLARFDGLAGLFAAPRSALLAAPGVGPARWCALQASVELARRSVAEDLTPVLVPVLFEHYRGPRPDPILLDWWSLAAELLVARVPAPG
jgi:DNA repair protein RadC